MTSAENSLRLVKLGHTIIWAIFAGSILAIPVLAWLGRNGLRDTASSSSDRSFYSAWQ
jgi:hypothetical protein